MNSNELPFLSATELAELIRTRGVSPVEVTEAYLSRIEQVDPSLNAYITVTVDRARAEAPAGRGGDRCRPLPGPAPRRSRGG